MRAHGNTTILTGVSSNRLFLPCTGRNQRCAGKTCRGRWRQMSCWQLKLLALENPVKIGERGGSGVNGVRHKTWDEPRT